MVMSRISEPTSKKFNLTQRGIKLLIQGTILCSPKFPLRHMVDLTVEPFISLTGPDQGQNRQKVGYWEEQKLSLTGRKMSSLHLLLVSIVFYVPLWQQPGASDRKTKQMSHYHHESTGLQYRVAGDSWKSVQTICRSDIPRSQWLRGQIWLVLLYSVKWHVVQADSDRGISVVACNNTQLVCATGCDIFYLEILQQQLVQKAHVILEHEVRLNDSSEWPWLVPTKPFFQ